MALWCDVNKVVDLLEKMGFKVSEWRDGDEYPMLVDLGEGLQEIFKKETRRSIEAVTTTKRFNGSGSDILPLDDYPIIIPPTPTIKYIEGIESYDYTEAELYYEQDTGLIFLNSATARREVLFPEGTRNIEVTWKHGFDTIPDLIKKAIRFSLMAMFITFEDDLEDQKRVLGVTSFKIGNYSETYPKEGQYYNEIRRWDMFVNKVVSFYKLVYIPD